MCLGNIDGRDLSSGLFRAAPDLLDGLANSTYHDIGFVDFDGVKAVFRDETTAVGREREKFALQFGIAVGSVAGANHNEGDVSERVRDSVGGLQLNEAIFGGCGGFGGGFAGFRPVVKLAHGFREILKDGGIFGGKDDGRFVD